MRQSASFQEEVVRMAVDLEKPTIHNDMAILAEATAGRQVCRDSRQERPKPILHFTDGLPNGGNVGK